MSATFSTRSHGDNHFPLNCLGLLLVSAASAEVFVSATFNTRSHGDMAAHQVNITDRARPPPSAPAATATQHPRPFQREVHLRPPATATHRP